MKYIFSLLLGSLLLVACSKEGVDNGIIVEPKTPDITLDDTLYSGSFLGVHIGASYTNVYDTLQQGWNSKKVAYLQPIALANNLDSAATRIPLYNSIYLSEMANVTVPIQINFANNRVASIYLGMNKVSQWPANQPAASSVQVGNTRESIYNKLLSIRSNSEYRQHLERFSLSSKDLSTPFDPNMNHLASWEFTSPIDSKRFYAVRIFFTAGVVSAIHRMRYE